MRESLVRMKMRKGEPVLSVAMAFAHPRIVEMMGGLGFDCIWICTEHGSVDPSVLEDSIRAARLVGMDTMIRVGRGTHCDLIRVLEMGASGLMLPRVRNAEEARRIVEDTRFYPLGQRGISGGGVDADLGRMPLKEYIEFANRNTFLCLQIEDTGAVEQVEEIASVVGVDMLFVGPTDLSQSLGVPGELKHPAVLDGIRKTVDACERHGIYCGTPGLGVEHTRLLLDMGVKFITAVSDLGLLNEGLRRTRDAYGALGFAFRADDPAERAAR